MFRRPLEPRSTQTLVDSRFGIVAVAERFVEEAAGVAFVEGAHHVAAGGGVVSVEGMC